VLQGVRGQQRHAAVGGAALGTVHARHGQPQGLQERVDLFDGAARDQGDSAAEILMQALQRADQGPGHAHGIGLWGDVHHGPIEIEEQCARWPEDLHESHAR
jgi:hypothetical protein